jgi:hypothetical protein
MLDVCGCAGIEDEDLAFRARRDRHTDTGAPDLVANRAEHLDTGDLVIAPKIATRTAGGASVSRRASPATTKVSAFTSEPELPACACSFASTAAGPVGQPAKLVYERPPGPKRLSMVSVPRVSRMRPDPSGAIQISRSS